MLGALLSVYMIISTPMSALQFTIAKLTAKFHDNQAKISTFYHTTSKYISSLGIISFLLFLLSSTLIVDYFQLDGFTGIIILSFSLLFLFHLAWNRGLMQGRLEFNQLAISLIIEGIIKLVCGVLLGYFLLKANYTIGSITISLLSAYVISAWYTWQSCPPPSLKPVKIEFTKRDIIIEAIRMFLGSIGILFFISIDVLMAHKYLPSYEAGLYTALSTLGKIVFFAPFSVAMAMFPFASQIKSHTKRLNLTKKALLLVIAIVTSITLVYFLFPGLIFSVLFGANYHNPGSLLGFVGLAIGIIGIIQLLINYLLSQKGFSFALALFISALSQTLIYISFHQNLNQFVEATLLSAVVMLVLVSISFWDNISKK